MTSTLACRIAGFRQPVTAKSAWLQCAKPRLLPNKAMWPPRGPPARSIYLGQNDGEDSRRLGRVGRVFGAEFAKGVEIVDLPNQLAALVGEAPEAVLLLGVVVRGGGSTRSHHAIMRGSTCVFRMTCPPRARRRGDRPAACYRPVMAELSTCYLPVIGPVIFPLSAHRFRLGQLESLVFSHLKEPRAAKILPVLPFNRHFSRAADLLCSHGSRRFGGGSTGSERPGVASQLTGSNTETWKPRPTERSSIVVASVDLPPVDSPANERAAAVRVQRPGAAVKPAAGRRCGPLAEPKASTSRSMTARMSSVTPAPRDPLVTRSASSLIEGRALATATA